MTGRMHHPLDKITRITPNRVLAWCLSALRQGGCITPCSVPSRLGSRAARRAYGPVDDAAQHVKALKVPRSPYDTASIIVTDTIEAMQAGIGNLPSASACPERRTGPVSGPCNGSAGTVAGTSAT